MRVHKTYSINSVVVKEFEEAVPITQRSRVLDALMIEFLVKEGMDGVASIHTIDHDRAREDRND